MLQRFFPRQIDNAYQGHVLALWLFVPVVAIKTAMGFNVAGLNPWISSRHVLQRVDGVPIDNFSAYGASIVSFIFAAWGLGLLILSLLAIVTLVRYRAMVPLMILAMSAEQVGRMILSRLYLASSRDGGVSIAAWINWSLTAALLLSLALSLLQSRKRAAAAAVAD